MAKDYSKYDDVKLKKLIDTLEDADPESEELEGLKAELKRRKKAMELSDTDVLETGMDEDELAAVASGISKRPVPGEYAAIIGKPEKDYSEKAIKIPITIIEEGNWKGYEGDAFYPSKNPAAMFGLKNIHEAAGVPAQKNPKTGKMFWPISLLEGKKIMAVYELKVTPGSWVGNDGVERENTAQSKLARAKPYHTKVQTVM